MSSEFQLIFVATFTAGFVLGKFHSWLRRRKVQKSWMTEHNAAEIRWRRGG